ncbi:MAG: pH regulation protein F [Candidatus Latescibacteria bacterium]|nr:pH regulation protein F [Candidatus Latescibacterota bacterium]
MYVVALTAVLLTLALALARGLKGPTIYDRILAANMAGTKTVLLIAVVGFLTDRPDFLDLALVYVLMNFIGTFAILKYVQHGDLGAARPPRSKASAP